LIAIIIEKNKTIILLYTGDDLGNELYTENTFIISCLFNNCCRMRFS